MLNELGRRLDAHNEKFNREKKKQTELKITMTEIGNTLEGNNSKLDDTEEWISELEDSSGSHPSCTEKRNFKNDSLTKQLTKD